MHFPDSVISLTILTVTFETSKTKNVLLSVRMDFFDRLKLSLSSPLRTFQTSSTDSNSSIDTSFLQLGNFDVNHIRLLLYRDCDKRGRKCLYDSRHVSCDKNGKFSYMSTGSRDGPELKNLSENIFGCVPITGNCGTKRFHKHQGNYIWSQVFSPKRCPDKIQSFCSSTTYPLHSSTSSGSPLNISPAPSLSGDEVDGTVSKRINQVNSLPNIGSSSESPFEKCFSLPSNMHHQSSQQKTLLGLGILIETTEQNQSVLGPYLQSMSGVIEECCSWFSSVASIAYCSPTTFVQTLYDFTIQFKNLIFSRLSAPLVSSSSLIPNWKALPALTSELTQLILQHDQRHCKLSERIKFVIIAGTKKVSEVAALLHLLKVLLLQCSRQPETDVGIDATAFCKDTTTCVNVNPNSSADESSFHSKSKLHSQSSSFDSTSFSMSSSAANISFSTTALSMSSMSSPSSPCISHLHPVHQVSFILTQPKIEEEKLQRRDYDSGIELELDSITNRSGTGRIGVPGKSMRRSISQKFDSGYSGSGSSAEEQSSMLPVGIISTVGNSPGRRYSRGSLLSPQRSHEFEEVCFHLGDFEVDSEQSINTLALSEPNLDKLKIQSGLPSYLERVNSNIEKLPSGKSSEIPVVQIRIDFNLPSDSTSKLPARGHCPYCEGIGIVSKFSPLFHIQWVRTSCCSGSSGLTEASFNLMKAFSKSRFIVVNLDKSLIRTINFDPNANSYRTKNLLSSCSTQNSSLVHNLIQNMQRLDIADAPKHEIESYFHTQLEFISKIAHEFGVSWTSTATSPDSSLKKKYSYLSLSDNDLQLIYSLAKMKFPNLDEASQIAE